MRLTRAAGPWAIVPEWVLDHPDLSDRAVRLYGVLARYADTAGGSFPKRKTLAARLHCSVDTLDRAIAQLEAVGALVSDPRYDESGRQTSNFYVLLDVPPAAPVQRGEGRTAAAPEGRTAAAPRTRAKRNEISGTTEVVPAGPPKLVTIDGRNVPFDTLADVCGIQARSPRITEVVAALQGTHNKPGIRALAWAEIVERGGRLAGPEAVEVAIGDLIRERAAQYEEAMGDALLTPTALLRWWVDLPTLGRRRGRAPDAMAGAQAAADELRRMT